MALALVDVAAACARWLWEPAGSVRVEGDGWVLVRYPTWAYTRLELYAFDPTGDPLAALDAVLAAGRELAPDANVVRCTRSLAHPEAIDAVFLARGGTVRDVVDVLALDLTGGVPDLGPLDPDVEVRWSVTPGLVLAANTVAVDVFDVPAVGEERAREAAAENADRIARGVGSGAVALVAGRPAGQGGVEVAGPDARLYGGGVREDLRGRGVYRALLAHRLAHAVEHDAHLAVTRGRIATSAPILRRAGFEAFGREHLYDVPLPPRD